MEQLGQEQIDSILLEGGGTLNWSALESGIVQQVQAYIARSCSEEGMPKHPLRVQVSRFRMLHSA